MVMNTFVSDESNHLLVANVIDELQFPLSGPPPLLRSRLDRDLMAVKFDLHDQAGYGYSRSEMSEFAVQYCHQYADAVTAANGGVATNQSERLRKAKCGKNFLKDNFLTPKDYEWAENTRPTISKTSEISFRRAEAADPTRQSTMARKFLAHMADCINSGTLPKGGPGGEDVEDWDEIGFDPWGRAYKTFSLFKDGKERRFSARHGERAPFWVTLLYGIRANGTLTAPIIVHQGSSMKGNFSMNLGEEFGVDCTKSGYADKDTFKVAVFSMSTAGRPKWIYVDGHHSHLDPDSLAFAVNHNIHINFLCAQNSVRDAAIDNGPNAMLKSLYRKRFFAWKMQHPGELLSKGDFNKIITEAWRKFEAEPDLKDCIIKAFVKTMTWPLVDPLPDIGVSSQADPARVTSGTMISAIYCTDDRDNDRKVEAAQVREVIVEDAPDVAGMKRVRWKEPIPGVDDTYGLLVNAYSHSLFEKSFIVPAQELAKRREEENRLKKITIPRAAPTCLLDTDCSDNESGEEEIDDEVAAQRVVNTTTGHCCTQATVDRVQAAAAQMEKKAADKLARKETANEKAKNTLMKQQVVYKRVIESIREIPTFNWRYETVDILKALIAVLPRSSETISAFVKPGTKAHLIALLESPMKVRLAGLSLADGGLVCDTMV